VRFTMDAICEHVQVFRKSLIFFVQITCLSKALKTVNMLILSQLWPTL